MMVESFSQMARDKLNMQEAVHVCKIADDVTFLTMKH